jgi:hypothetical protein
MAEHQQQVCLEELLEQLPLQYIWSMGLKAGII